MASDRQGRSSSRTSLLSISSKTSQKSTASLSSRASQFFRFRSSSRSGSSSAELTVAVGDQCETISMVTVRVDEALESDVVETLVPGTLLTIEEVGELPRRAKIVAGSVTGWISVKTRLNEPLVTKRSHDVQEDVADFEVGGQHEVQSLVTVRAGESLDSEVITELKPGTIVRIKELGVINKRRGKVETDALEGWISLTTRQGRLLIGKVSESGGARASRTSTSSSAFFGTSSSKIKSMLESARCGDLDTIKKIVEGSNGLMSRLSGRPDLNCSDIRGKTALIYAVAFGHRNVVEYLLTKKFEVDVNSLDDTQKSALHHASKRARKCRGDQGDETQSKIVLMLLNSGSLIEARDHNGCTALMFAVANGDAPVADVLLKAGANANVKDYEGHTPLDYARNFGYEELAKKLKEAGAEGDDDEEEDTSRSISLNAAPTQDAAAGVEEAEAIANGSPLASVDSSSPKEAKKKISVRRKSKVSASKDVSRSEGVEEAAVNVTEAAAVERRPSETQRGSVKLRPKSKAKGKAKVKVKAKAKPAMLAMVDELDASAEAKVEVLDLKEEADEKELALDKLKAILASSDVVGEIEGALHIAKAACVDDSDLAEAEQKVKDLKQRALASDRLRIAVDCPDVGTLTTAIAEAERSGVSAAEIARAKEALENEIPKQKARELLKAAQDAGDAAKLRSALAEAEKVQLSVEETAPFEELLKGAESKEQASAVLKSAIASRDVAQLKFSIQQARDASVEEVQIAEAEAILKEEEPKAKARETIAAALAKIPVDVPALEAAIQEAKNAKLDAAEYLECENVVKKEAEKAAALAEVKKVNVHVREIDMTSIDAIGAAKSQLHNAITVAKEIGVAETDLHEFELRRRKLHNAIEDLKGSIRVFCRVRPLSSKEAAQGDVDITKRIDEMTISVSTDKQENKFAFDAVFFPGTQAEVFDDCRDLVQSAADGYNVTLFAYGQTGAGKTYTMGGTPDNPGVSRLTINEIYRVTEANSARYNFTIMGSMMELYRQDLVDLLAAAKEGRGNVKKLQVRSDKAGGVLVEGLMEQECTNPDQLATLLERGMAGRKTLSTNMNDQSSRSHLLFVVKIISVNKETHDKLFGKICIVDLAGSERLGKSQVTGEGAKEAIEINKSLTALGDVIEALTKNQKAIPYRNHKLTMVMQDSIGGSAKTLMFVNCSPAASNAEETIMSLKYATRAKKITNTTKKQSIAPG